MPAPRLVGLQRNLMANLLRRELLCGLFPQESKRNTGTHVGARLQSVSSPRYTKSSPYGGARCLLAWRPEHESNVRPTP